MATLRDLKIRIKGVKNTQQITKAMKMVAAAKLRRAQENIINARPYAQNISVLLSHVITEDDLKENVMVASRDNVKNIAIVVVTADRGLCGAFNMNIVKESLRYVNEDLDDKSVNISYFCVGKKGFDYFNKRDYNVTHKKIGFFSSLMYEDALSITNELIKNYLDGTFDKVIIIYNEFKSIIQQKIVVEQFLPVPLKKEENKKEKVIPNYIFEPNQNSIFEYLLPKYLKAQMWRILLESNASEQGAKMTAMDNATTNAKELISTLQLTYNKARQAAITKEILEIVSGANALQAN